MAATELSGAVPSRARAREAARAWIFAYTAIWAVTLMADATVALAAGGLARLVRAAIGLTLTPAHNAPAQLDAVAVMAAHNAPIAAWPLLLGLAGLQRARFARGAADCLVLASMLANSVPVGAALGAYGTRLLAYVPQLPIEWAGLALGYGGWLVQRRREMSSRERALWLSLVLLAMFLAAIIESSAVPHR